MARTKNMSASLSMTEMTVRSWERPTSMPTYKFEIRGVKSEGGPKSEVRTEASCSPPRHRGHGEELRRNCRAAGDHWSSQMRPEEGSSAEEMSSSVRRVMFSDSKMHS